MRSFRFAIFLIVVAAISYSAHVEIYLDFHERNPETYLADSVPTARADAYYWFRAAREVRDDVWQVGELDSLRAYPDGIRRGDPPMIARIVAQISDWTGRDVCWSGQFLALVTSCLFLFPLGFYAIRIGHPAAGLVAGSFAAASPVVFARTAIYHVDTDAVNLFLLWLITLAIACVPYQRSRSRRALLTLVAAFSTALLVEWYERELFYVVFLAAFPICLLAGRMSRRSILVLTILFAICANPLNLKPSIINFANAVELYVSGFANETPAADKRGEPSSASEHVNSLSTSPRTSRMKISQNDLMSSVAEGQRLSAGRSLSLIGDPGWLVAVELVAFLIWSVWHWRLAAPLLPLGILGLMGFVVSNRFLLFLAPFAGLGLGLVYSYVIRGIAVRVGYRAHAKTLACVFALPLVALPAFVTRPPWAAERPFSVEYIRSLQRAAEYVPPGSPVWALWGHGYLLQDVMGAATFRDGLPDLEVGHFYLKSLTGEDPKRLHQTIAYLQSHSQRDVRRRFWAEYEKLDEEISGYDGSIERSSFLLLTEDSMKVFGAEHRLGQWTPGDGWPPHTPIRRSYCRARQGNRLQCGEPGMGYRVFDLLRGTIDGIPSFGRVVTSRQGFKTSEKRTRNSKPQFLELINESDGSISVYPMERDAYFSLVNQLYALAEFDERHFELVYDDFPRVRLYRFESNPE